MESLSNNHLKSILIDVDSKTINNFLKPLQSTTKSTSSSKPLSKCNDLIVPSLFCLHEV